jgi:hypothetical protein
LIKNPEKHRAAVHRRPVLSAYLDRVDGVLKTRRIFVSGMRFRRVPPRGQEISE